MNWTHVYYEPVTGQYFRQFTYVMYSFIRSVNKRIDDEGPVSINDVLTTLGFEKADTDTKFDDKKIARVAISAPKEGIVPGYEYRKLLYKFIN